MNKYTIYCESFPRSQWLVLKYDTVHTNLGYFYTKFAECDSYQDAKEIVDAMMMTDP